MGSTTALNFKLTQNKIPHVQSTKKTVKFNSCVRGYHTYREAEVGEELECRREPTNIKDHYVLLEGILLSVRYPWLAPSFFFKVAR